MEVKANVKHIRMSPRKIRLVVDVARGLEANKALDQLKFIRKWAVRPVVKLINSAIANAENNFELDKNNLYIKEIKVDEGSTLHRWRPRAYGRAASIRKRTSHINLVLAEIKDSGRKGAKKRKVEAPVKLDGKPTEQHSSASEQAGKKNKKNKDDNISHGMKKEKGHEVIDPRMEGKGQHTKAEGKSAKGFVNKMFRRKSG